MNRAMYILLAAGLLLGAAATATATTYTATQTADASATVNGQTVACSASVVVTVSDDGSAPTVSDPTPKCTGV